MFSASAEINSNVHGPAHTVTTRNYTLNINRALKRKLQGCEQVNVDYEVKAGGVTGTLDTASFELFRLACTEFFNKMPPEEGRCVIDYSEDKLKKALVQQTYRVSSPTSERWYTLNLYPTNNTTLLNGKQYSKFIQDHLPVIHQIMCQAVKDQNLGSVASFNEILGSQLQRIIDERTCLNDGSDTSNRPSAQETSVTNKPSEPPVEKECGRKDEENVTCLRCKRPTKSRGAYCEAGSHWIHYFCDKLTEFDIDRLQNDPGFIYTCKICTDLNENTNLKTPVSPQPSDSKSPKSLLVLPDVSASGSAAVDILEEECGSDCNVCHTRIDEPPNRCDYCQSECHDCCMVHASDSGEICLSCAASQTQTDESRQTTDLSQEIPKREETREGKIQPCQTLIAVQSAPKTAVETVTADNELSDHIQRSGTRVKDKKNPDALNVKQRELRQLEIKLKKWEEDLKMQDAKAGSKNNDSRKLEDYLQRTEARNVELEATIRTLQRKICMLEKATPISTCVPGQTSTNHWGSSQGSSNVHQPEGNYSYGGVIRPNEDPVHKANNELIRGIHKQVTSFILKKVSQQISSLETFDNFIQLQQQQQVSNSNSFGSNLRNEMNSEFHDFYPDFNSQQETSFTQCFNPLQKTDFNPYVNSQHMNNFNPSFKQHQSESNCDFNFIRHANPEQMNNRCDRQQTVHEVKHPMSRRQTEYGRSRTRDGDMQETQRVSSHERRDGNHVPRRAYHERAPFRYVDRRERSGNWRRPDIHRVPTKMPEPKSSDRGESSHKQGQPRPPTCVGNQEFARKSEVATPSEMEARFELEVQQLTAHPKHITTEQAAVIHGTREDSVEPSSGDGRMPVKDLDREESSNQEQQLQDPPKPCIPAQPTAGDSIINTVDAPQSQTGSPFTVEGPPIFYGTRQRGNEGAAGSNQSFLYRARPNRGRL